MPFLPTPPGATPYRQSFGEQLLRLNVPQSIAAGIEKLQALQVRQSERRQDRKDRNFQNAVNTATQLVQTYKDDPERAVLALNSLSTILHAQGAIDEKQAAALTGLAGAQSGEVSRRYGQAMQLLNTIVPKETLPKLLSSPEGAAIYTDLMTNAYHATGPNIEPEDQAKVQGALEQFHNAISQIGEYMGGEAARAGKMEYEKAAALVDASMPEADPAQREYYIALATGLGPAEARMKLDKAKAFYYLNLPRAQAYSARFTASAADRRAAMQEWGKATEEMDRIVEEMSKITGADISQLVTSGQLSGDVTTFLEKLHSNTAVVSSLQKLTEQYRIQADRANAVALQSGHKMIIPLMDPQSRVFLGAVSVAPELDDKGQFDVGKTTTAISALVKQRSKELGAANIVPYGVKRMEDGMVKLNQYMNDAYPASPVPADPLLRQLVYPSVPLPGAPGGPQTPPPGAPGAPVPGTSTTPANAPATLTSGSAPPAPPPSAVTPPPSAPAAVPSAQPVQPTPTPTQSPFPPAATTPPTAQSGSVSASVSGSIADGIVGRGLLDLQDFYRTRGFKGVKVYVYGPGQEQALITVDKKPDGTKGGVIHVKIDPFTQEVQAITDVDFSRLSTGSVVK